LKNNGNQSTIIFMLISHMESFQNGAAISSIIFPLRASNVRRLQVARRSWRITLAIDCGRGAGESSLAHAKRRQAAALQNEAP
jgi:hypothetical protein